jgi:hypothetical protein
MPGARRSTQTPRRRRLLLVALAFTLVIAGATAIVLDSHGVGWALVVGGAALAVAGAQE